MARKYIIQSLLIIFEILLIPGLVTLLSNNWSSINDFNECLNRFLTFTAIYEFLVYLINKNQLDARKDSLLICKTLFKQTFNILKSAIENDKIYNMKTYFKNELILVEHELEVEDLKWKNTLILKFFK